MWANHVGVCWVVYLHSLYPTGCKEVGRSYQMGWFRPGLPKLFQLAIGCSSMAMATIHCIEQHIFFLRCPWLPSMVSTAQSLGTTGLSWWLESPVITWSQCIFESCCRNCPSKCQQSISKLLTSFLVCVCVGGDAIFSPWWLSIKSMVKFTLLSLLIVPLLLPLPSHC